MTDHYDRFVAENTGQAVAPLVPEIVLNLATAVTPLWQATEATLARTNLPPPFWAFAWPGGQALARLVLDRPALVEGRSVLDFAAGCGVAAIAAARAGASRVIASEIDAFAAAAIAQNARLSGVDIAITLDDAVEGPADLWDVVLAGDVCYEKPMAARVVPWLCRAARAGATVLLADPGRAYLPSDGLTEIARYDVPTSLDLENRTLMTTVVYRYEPI